MGPLSRPFELVAGPAGEDLAAMIDVVLEQRLEVEHHRPALYQRQ